MNLKKAIHNLERLEPLTTQYLHRDYEKAVKLGIEALKRVDFSRRDPNRPSEPPLPGETEEPLIEPSPHQETVSREIKGGTK